MSNIEPEPGRETPITLEDVRRLAETEAGEERAAFVELAKADSRLQNPETRETLGRIQDKLQRAADNLDAERRNPMYLWLVAKLALDAGATAKAAEYTDDFLQACEYVSDDVFEEFRPFAKQILPSKPTEQQ